MTHFKVSFEIEVDADSPLEAAKIVNRMMDDHPYDGDACGWQFYVQEDDTNKIYSVDLDEEDDDAVLPVDDYYPFIINNL